MGASHGARGGSDGRGAGRIVVDADALRELGQRVLDLTLSFALLLTKHGGIKLTLLEGGRMGVGVPVGEWR